VHHVGIFSMVLVSLSREEDFWSTQLMFNFARSWTCVKIIVCHLKYVWWRKYWSPKASPLKH